MATGAVLIVKNLPEFTSYVGDAGLSYGDVDDADRLLTGLPHWPDTRWGDQWHRSVDRAFTLYADETALRPIFDDWIAALRPRLLSSSDAARCSREMAAVPLGS